MSFNLPPSKKNSDRSKKTEATERDPLLQGTAVLAARGATQHVAQGHHAGSIRSRRTSSRSPVQQQPHFAGMDMIQSTGSGGSGSATGGGATEDTAHQQQSDDHFHDGYQAIEDTVNQTVEQSRLSSAAAVAAIAAVEQQQQQQQQQASSESALTGGPGFAQGESPPDQSRASRSSTRREKKRRQKQQEQRQHLLTGNYGVYGAGTLSSPSSDSQSIGSGMSQQPPLLEIPEEIYAIRKAALQVLKPLTKTWVVISVGFALTVLFGTARWTRLMPNLPFWFILLPCWCSHGGLLWLHVLSARALSSFIAEANESRQRPDSRDHLNRTEYLPLLQRSLKFGLKTGLLSFFIFLFEVLIYVRLARNSISLTAAFVPLWLLVAGGIVDGLICKTQHFLRVMCWVLSFVAMVLTVMKVDYHYDDIRWRVVVSPVVAVLSIASATLIYIVYGHQVGYYRLTESQLTAGNLYSLAALVCMVLMVMIGEVIPLSRPVEVETRIFVVVLAPLVVCLVGMGAWVVSRDEFARLLLYGGQSAVHPMKLRWEANGWTSVQGRGVTVIPMFGDVNFQPLGRKEPARERMLELCTCCSGSCYPYEDEDEETAQFTADDLGYHPYLNT